MVYFVFFGGGRGGGLEEKILKRLHQISLGKNPLIFCWRARELAFRCLPLPTRTEMVSSLMKSSRWECKQLRETNRKLVGRQLL